MITWHYKNENFMKIIFFLILFLTFSLKSAEFTFESYGKMDMISTKYVSIIGHVQNPGQYTLQDNLTLYDLIFKAGGFLDQDFKNQFVSLNKA